MRTITHRDLRKDSGEIMGAPDEGEECVVTRNGVPVDELRPVRRRFVRSEVLLNAMRDIPPLDAERFRADIDTVLDQTINPQA